MNIEKVRAEYPDLVIMGGLDKIAISMGKDGVKKEVEKVRKVLDTGGYIPYTDHAVLPEVSFDNHRFSEKRLIRF